MNPIKWKKRRKKTASMGGNFSNAGDSTDLGNVLCGVPQRMFFYICEFPWEAAWDAPISWTESL